LPPVSLTPVANLPLVLLIPVVHLDLQISPRIFEKIRSGPNGILRGWGETDSKKKPEAKNLVTLSPFKLQGRKRLDFLRSLKASPLDIVFLGLICPRQKEWLLQEKHFLKSPFEVPLTPIRTSKLAFHGSQIYA
jgi:hypothetical protein